MLVNYIGFNMLIEYINIPNNLWHGIYQTGSSIICDPPVLNTDIDYVIYTDNFDELDKFLLKNEFKTSCKDKEEYDLNVDGMNCYRRDNINLIVVNDYDFYIKWVNATKLAKKLNLKDKKDRITLFQFVLYGELCET